MRVFKKWSFSNCHNSDLSTPTNKPFISSERAWRALSFGGKIGHFYSLLLSVTGSWKFEIFQSLNFCSRSALSLFYHILSQSPIPPLSIDVIFIYVFGCVYSVSRCNSLSTPIWLRADACAGRADNGDGRWRPPSLILTLGWNLWWDCRPGTSRLNNHPNRP